MDNLSAIASGALNAYGIKQAVTANNVANIYSTGFTSSSTEMQEAESGGVTASVVKGNDEVDISREAVDMLTTVNGYKANLKTLQTADEMSRELLSIKA